MNLGGCNCLAGSWGKRRCARVPLHVSGRAAAGSGASSHLLRCGGSKPCSGGSSCVVSVCARTCLATASHGALCFCRSKFQGEKVPTLREAVVESMRHNLTIYFDVKGHASQVQLSVLRHLPSPFFGFLTCFSVSLKPVAWYNPF